PPRRRRSPCSTPLPSTTLFRSQVVLLSDPNPHGVRIEEVPTRLGNLRQQRLEGLDFGEFAAGLQKPFKPFPMRQRQSEGFGRGPDRKSTRLNSSHGSISYAVFC